VIRAVLIASALLAAQAAVPAHAPVVRQVVLGRSVDGRPITAEELGDRASRFKVLVVGCIHGNEPAGIAITDELARLQPPAGVDLWIVPDLNPDGVAAHTRGNARGVDLNRNFPTRWQRLSGVYDSGPRPLSEPEARIAYRLVLRLRPTISIWFHQHLDLVDTSTGDPALERLFARLVGLRAARLAREPGSVVGWEAQRFPPSSPFVVELPAGAPGAGSALRIAAAIDVLALAALRFDS
jgi:protein MpaA